MRLSKRNIPLLGCAAVGGLLAFGLARSVRSATPLDRAEAIADTARWQSELGNPAGNPLYFWSDRNDLTYLSAGHDGATHVFRRSGNAGKQGEGQEGPELHLRGGYPGQVSPDGRWFVEWHQNKLRQRLPTFLALDGSGRKIEGKPTWGWEAIWTSDSSRMVSAVWRKGASLDRYDPTTGALENIPIPNQKNFSSPQRFDSRGRVVGFQHSAFVLNIGNTRVAQIQSYNYPALQLARADLTHPTTPPEQWTVPVLGELDFGNCLISPSGDRILWILHGDTTPTLLRKLRRYLPGKIAGPAIGYRWLVSGLHGEDLHEVASYRYQPDRRQPNVRDPYSQPRWLPDSKHISFIFRNTLYVRPVD